MQASLLAQRDYAIGPASKLLRFRIRGANLFLSQQRGDEVTYQSPAMARIAAEFSASLEVTHALRGLLFVGALACLDLFTRGKMIDLHAEFEAHLAQNLLDFVERLVAEVLRL